jgi:DNA repair protein RadD
MYKLRDYQEFAVAKGVEGLTKRNPKPFVLQLATGAGKSIIIADIVNKLQAKVLVLQPQKELVEQNYEKMMSYKPNFDVGVYCAGLGRKEIYQVTYATIHSVHRKPELFEEFEYIIIDECHQVDPKGFDEKKKGGMYANFFKAIGTNRVCGLTATPYRLEQKFYYEGDQKYYTSHLKMINRIHPFFFKSIVCKVETDQLIKRGYLSPILYRQIDLGNMDDLVMSKNGSDYTTESLVEFWRNDRRLQKLADCIVTIDKYCQRNLVFCSSLLQARRAKEMLEQMGIRAEMVSGDTPKKERTALVKAYRAGEFKHMLNVGVFTTGFDVPELDCVVLARPTVSLALYYQMVGRGVRLDPQRPEKKLRVYDLVRLSEKLGRVETIKVLKELDPDTGKPTWLDEVRSEAGVMTNVPLFKFRVNK